jgi:hypothetical protein
MAYTCECECTRVKYVPGTGWAGCSSGVHCGINGNGCGYAPRVK